MTHTTHIPHPVTRSEFARRARRGRSRITEATAPRGPLERACLPGGLLDAAHPAVLTWCAKRKIDHSALLDPGAVATPASFEAMLTDAAETFADRIAAAVRTGDVEPRALVLVLDVVGRLLADAKRKLVAAAAPPPSNTEAQPADSAHAP